jgi:streptomycin 3"-adenylyltransferase
VRLPPREAIDHTPGRAQQWRDADTDVRQWVDAILGRLDHIEGVIAVYLHGSLAMGSFFRPKSDVDLLVVVEEPLTNPHRRRLAADLLQFLDQRPIVGGIELSVVRRGSLESFEHPMPYELHFSEKWAEDVREGGSGPRGTDPDLAAHCTMTRLRGLSLRGPEPSVLIGEVPYDAYLDAVMGDVRWILDGGIVKSPFYGVLNLCRTLQTVLSEPELPPSKDEGGRWALDNLPPEHRAVVTAAMECYRSRAVVPLDLRPCHGHVWDEIALLDIAAYSRNILQERL